MSIKTRSRSIAKNFARLAFSAMLLFGGFFSMVGGADAAITESECKAKYGDLSACLDPNGSIPGNLIKTDDLCSGVGIKSCYAHQFGGFRTSSDSECQNQAQGRCQGTPQSGCGTGSSFTKPMGICYNNVVVGDEMCCAEPAIGQTCVGSGFSCEASESACSGSQTKDTSGKTCTIDPLKKTCCAPKLDCTSTAIGGTCSADACDTLSPAQDLKPAPTSCDGTAKSYCCVPKGSTSTCPGTCSADACDTLSPAQDLKPAPTSCDGTAKSYCCVPKGSPTNTTGGPTATSFSNPLQYNTVQDVLGGLLSALQGIIVILSIIFIVIGAVLYVTSGGNSKQIESAKSAITAAMIGLAIGIAAPSFLKEISGILGWDAAPANVSGAISLTAILTNVLNFLLGIVGILSIIMLIIGAIMYVTAAGVEDRIDDGKKIVKYAIIGIIVTFASLVIVKQIAALFVV